MGPGANPMSTSTSVMNDPAVSRGPFRAPRGTELSCKGWQQEAALRMLLNNLDPEVAEKPEDLVVYGGTGKAARNWDCFHAIVKSLRALEGDETLLSPVGQARGRFQARTIMRRGCYCAIPIWSANGTTGKSLTSWIVRA